jgi:hydrogenase nickel incorporation protein HypA/HybF
MHELSIAYSIVSQAADAGRRAGATRVTSVRIRVGALSGVSGEALLFAYDVAVEGTLLEGSRLDIQHVPVVIHCAACGRASELPDVQSFRCPVCDAPSADVRGGRELEIESLEVEDAEVTEPAPEA